MAEGKKEIGKKIFDITDLVDVFEAQEGEVQQIIGKTGNGKTYEATRRALNYLKQGYTVYTTWQLILPDYYDERQNKEMVLWRLLGFKKTFYKFNLRKNWKFLDIDRPDLIQFVASLTDCIVMLDEGQDIFDSRERMQKSSRKTITRTRHMHKTLIIISQRAQAVDVTARANVTFFYKCVKGYAWFWPFKPYFKVYRTEEMDQQNFPIWEELSTGWQAPIWHSGFANQEVYDSYNSWYLRAGIPRSQELDFEAYNLSTWDKIKILFSSLPKQERVMSDEAIADLEKRNIEKFLEDTKVPEKKLKKQAKLSTGVDKDVDNFSEKESIINKIWEKKEKKGDSLQNSKEELKSLTLKVQSRKGGKAMIHSSVKPKNEKITKETTRFIKAKTSPSTIG